MMSFIIPPKAGGGGGGVDTHVLDLTGATSLPAGVTVEDGAIDSFDGGLVLDNGLLLFPHFGAGFDYSAINSAHMFAVFDVIGNQLDGGMGCGVGLYSPSADMFVGGGLTGRNITQWCFSGRVTGAKASITYTINSGFLSSANLDGVEITMSVSVKRAPSNVDICVNGTWPGLANNPLTWPNFDAGTDFEAATDLQVALAVADDGRIFATRLKRMEALIK